MATPLLLNCVKHYLSGGAFQSKMERLCCSGGAAAVLPPLPPRVPPAPAAGRLAGPPATLGSSSATMTARYSERWSANAQGRRTKKHTPEKTRVPGTISPLTIRTMVELVWDRRGPQQHC